MKKKLNNTQPTAATLPRRVAAMLYDSFIVLALLILASFPIVIINGDAVTANTWWYNLYLLLIIYTYFAYSWWRGKQTIGMRAWRLSLVTLDNTPIRYSHCIKRCLWATSSLIPCGIGLWWMLWDKQKLTWYDRCSKTCLQMSPLVSRCTKNGINSITGGQNRN